MTTGTRAGISSIQKGVEERAAARAARQGPRIYSLYLNGSGSGEFARFRFASSGDDELLASAYIHRIQAKRRDGSTWYPKIYCVRDDGEDCVYCEGIPGVREPNRPRVEFATWIYVYEAFRNRQNPWQGQSWEERGENGETVTVVGEEWELRKRGVTTYHVQPVNDFMILQLSFGRDDVIWNQLTAHYARYDTLAGRDYEISRTGENLQTTYQISPLDPSPDPENWEESKTDLMSIAEYFLTTVPETPPEATEADELQEVAEESTPERVVVEDEPEGSDESDPDSLF